MADEEEEVIDDGGEPNFSDEHEVGLDDDLLVDDSVVGLELEENMREIE